MNTPRKSFIRVCRKFHMLNLRGPTPTTKLSENKTRAKISGSTVPGKYMDKYIHTMRNPTEKLVMDTIFMNFATEVQRVLATNKLLQMVSCKSLTSLVTSTQKMFLRTSVFILCFRAKSITQASPLLGTTEHGSKTPFPTQSST